MENREHKQETNQLKRKKKNKKKEITKNKLVYLYIFKIVFMIGLTNIRYNIVNHFLGA